MSKEEIINYVMTTPSNPNKAVLSGMLDSVAQSGGTDPFVVYVMQDAVSQTYTVDSCNKTYEELADYIQETGDLLCTVMMDVKVNGSTVQKVRIFLPGDYYYDGNTKYIHYERHTLASNETSVNIDKVRYMANASLPEFLEYKKNFAS